MGFCEKVRSRRLDGGSAKETRRPILWTTGQSGVRATTTRRRCSLGVTRPRKIPYLFLWRSERDGKPKDAVRVAACDDPGPFYGTSREFFPIRGAFHPCSWIAVKRHDGRCDILRGVWLPLPRNGARELLLLCYACGNPRRYLYGWEAAGPYTSSAEASHWMCRGCAKLCYSSEGGFLRPGRMLSAFGNLSRPRSFWPYVFSSIDDPRLDEILRS
jgi:hypothetical protein